MAEPAPAAGPVGATGGRTRVLAAVLWPLALTSAANLVFRSYVEPRVKVDFLALHDGAVRFAEGASVYADPLFLLTPSGLLAITPFGRLDQVTGFAVWNTLALVAAAVGVALSLRLVGVSLRGPVAAGVVLAFSLSEALTVTLILGNLNNMVLLALAAGYLLAERQDRPVLAGVLLGLSLAVKPVLVLFLLVPLLRRGWSTLVLAVAIPLVANVVGFLVTPVRDDFLRVTLPLLLEARPDVNSSLWAVGTYFGVPELVLTLLRLLVLGLTLLVVWRLRGVADPVLRLATTSGVLLLATFLGNSLSQMYYSMLLLPLLLTVVLRRSPVHNPLAWFAVYLFATTQQWVLPDRPNVSAGFLEARPTAGWALLLVVLAVWALRLPRDLLRPTGSTTGHPTDLADADDPTAAVRGGGTTTATGPAR